MTTVNIPADTGHHGNAQALMSRRDIRFAVLVHIKYAIRGTQQHLHEQHVKHPLPRRLKALHRTYAFGPNNANKNRAKQKHVSLALFQILNDNSKQPRRCNRCAQRPERYGKNPPCIHNKTHRCRDNNSGKSSQVYVILRVLLTMEVIRSASTRSNASSTCGQILRVPVV